MDASVAMLQEQLELLKQRLQQLESAHQVLLASQVGAISFETASDAQANLVTKRGRVESAESAASAEGRTSRRGLLKYAGVAAVGAVASQVVMAQPAAAVDGDPLLIGKNQTEVSGTVLAYGTAVNTAGPAIETTDSTMFTVDFRPSTAAATGNAIRGYARAGGTGVIGTSDSGGDGVRGSTVSGNGVRGIATSGDAIFGQSTSGIGVVGASTTGVGVQGGSGPSAGVFGNSISGIGVSGTSTSGRAVSGISQSNYGVYGRGSQGVYGESVNGSGVFATSTNGNGVTATSPAATAVTGEGVIGVEGRSPSPGAGYGLVSTMSGRAALYLRTENELRDLAQTIAPKTAPPLRADAHQRGELDTDSNGDLWYCAVSGTPGTWRKIGGPSTAGSFHAIVPARVYDSRSPAPLQGQLSAASRLVSVANGRDLISGAIVLANVVPAGATAISVNVTVTNTTGGGFLVVNPGGNTTVTSSSINWFAAGQTFANGIIAAINANREVTVIAGSSGSADFILDVTGYYL